MYRNDKLVSMRNGSKEYLSMSNIVTQRWSGGSLAGFYFLHYLELLGEDSAWCLTLLNRRTKKNKNDIAIKQV